MVHAAHCLAPVVNCCRCRYRVVGMLLLSPVYTEAAVGLASTNNNRRDIGKGIFEQVVEYHAEYHGSCVMFVWRTYRIDVGLLSLLHRRNSRNTAIVVK